MSYTLSQWYTVADIFVNPTYEDNYPTVNLEAQGCGTRVITYATGGSVETVTSENIVPQGDINKIVDIIIKNGRKKDIKPTKIPSRKEFCLNYIKLYEE